MTRTESTPKTGSKPISKAARAVPPAPIWKRILPLPLEFPRHPQAAEAASGENLGGRPVRKGAVADPVSAPLRRRRPARPLRRIGGYLGNRGRPTPTSPRPAHPPPGDL